MQKIKSITTANGRTWPSISLDEPSVICVDGASGSGKTLFFNELIKLHFKENIFYGSHVVYIPQSPTTFRGSIIDNITLYRNFCPNRLAMLCENFGFGHVDLGAEIFDKGFPLSGGELQRLIIVRALLCSPEVILADETTSAMDLELATSVHKQLIENSKILFFSSHHDSLKLLSDIKI